MPRPAAARYRRRGPFYTADIITVRAAGQAAEAASKVSSRLGEVSVPKLILVGDDDGVVVIPRGDLEQVIAAAEAKGEKEAGWVAALKNGQNLAEIHGFAQPTNPD